MQSESGVCKTVTGIHPEEPRPVSTDGFITPLGKEGRTLNCVSNGRRTCCLFSRLLSVCRCVELHMRATKIN